MGEPPQTLSTGPFPTPFLPLTPHQENFMTIGLSLIFLASGPPTFLDPWNWTLMLCPSPLATDPTWASSVYGTEPQWKEEEWSFHLSHAPRPKTGVRDKGEDQCVGISRPVPTYTPSGWGQASQNLARKGKHDHTTLRATLYSWCPARGRPLCYLTIPHIWEGQLCTPWSTPGCYWESINSRCDAPYQPFAIKSTNKKTNKKPNK